MLYIEPGDDSTVNTVIRPSCINTIVINTSVIAFARRYCDPRQFVGFFVCPSFLKYSTSLICMTFGICVQDYKSMKVLTFDRSRSKLLKGQTKPMFIIEHLQIIIARSWFEIFSPNFRSTFGIKWLYKFQPPFLKPFFRNISASDWEISTKFCALWKMTYFKTQVGGFRQLENFPNRNILSAVGDNQILHVVGFQILAYRKYHWLMATDMTSNKVQDGDR